MENLEFAEFSILHIVAVIYITCEYYTQTVSIHVVSAPVGMFQLRKQINRVGPNIR